MSKGLEALEQLYLQFNPNLTSEDNSLKYKNTIEKELKALEVIKEKGVCLPALKLTASFEEDNLEEYNKICLKHFTLPLTKEEYELLKEVLL